MDGVCVSWQHVDDFFQMAPKLTATEKDISLPPFSALRMRYATQVLSHLVAAGLSVLMQLQVLPEEASVTASFIEHFDQLFNAFNSGNLKSKQVMGQGISEKSGHSEFLQETLAWIETVQSSSTHALPCLSGC